MNYFSYFKFMKWLFPFIVLGSSPPNVTINGTNYFTVKLSSAINILTVTGAGSITGCDLSAPLTSSIVSQKIAGVTLRDLNCSVNFSAATISSGNTGNYFGILNSNIVGTLAFPSLSFPLDIEQLELTSVTGLTGIAWTNSFPGKITATGIASLQTLTFNSVVEVDTNVDININFSGCGLNQTSVDALLDKCATLGGAWIINVSGGTNAAPSAAGLVSKATIISNGGSVTNN